MQGVLILAAFFSLFVLASLLIPSPMVPGALFCMLIGGAAGQYADYISAFFNGIFYGIILWLVFVSVSRRLGKER